jgi:transposase
MTNLQRDDCVTKAPLRAVVEGKHDAGWMADYARGSLRGKRRELEAGLGGQLYRKPTLALDKELRQLESLESQIPALEQEIERQLEPFQEPMQRWMTIPGIDRKTAWTIVAELGVDRGVFTDSKHLASWAGLCPGNRESGGKRMSGRTGKANRYVKRGMCQAAWAASHTRTRIRTHFTGGFRCERARPKRSWHWRIGLFPGLWRG